MSPGTIRPAGIIGDMKARYGYLLLFAALLSGCAGFPDFGSSRRPSHAWPKPHVQPQRANDSAAILAEANRLATQVRNGELSRGEAADRLNRYRVERVGHNVVDDSTFATYRSLTVAREKNQINQEEFQSRMQARLQDWQVRWPTLQQRPANPAFTNFLMDVYNYPQLKP